MTKWKTIGIKRAMNWTFKTGEKTKIQKCIKIQPTFKRHENFLYSLRSFKSYTVTRNIKKEKKTLKQKEWKTNRYSQSNFNKSSIFSFWLCNNGRSLKTESTRINSMFISFFACIFYENKLDNETKKISHCHSSEPILHCASMVNTYIDWL